MNIIEKAKKIATVAHAAVGQRRKYTGEPYIVHPAEVAAMVNRVPGRTDEMVAAAWVHDVVEDTDVTIELIGYYLGPIVAEYTGWLTDISVPEDGNRDVRKAIDREHSARAPAEVHTIKTADLLSNTKSIVAHDPGFAKVYIAEKALLLEVLTKGDRYLHERCVERVEAYYAAIHAGG